VLPKNVNCLLAVCLIFTSHLQANLIDYKYPNHNIASFSNYSTLGLIQNPNARFHPAGTLAFSWSRLNPYLRGAIVAYPFDWLEAAYHYTDINNALYSFSPEFSGSQSYKDKGFDFKVRLFKERKYLPQVAAGVRDFAGTGVFEAEYLAFSKRTNNIDYTLGFGFGSLANNSIKNPLLIVSSKFKNRLNSNSDTQGGEPDFGKFFRGEAGLFGGVEIILPSKKGIRLKIEYDGTDYMKEGFPLGGESFKYAFQSVRQSQSRFNFGAVYPVNKNLHLKASFVKGNTLSFGFSVSGFLGHKNPVIKKNDPQKDVENINEIKYLTNNNDLFLYRAALIELKKRGFYINKADRTEELLTINYSQSKYRSAPLMAGRISTVLDAVAPNYIKEFELINFNAGMPLNSIRINRSNFIKHKKDNLFPLALNGKKVEAVTPDQKTYKYNPDSSFPNTFWRIAPNLRTQIGGPDGFFFGDLSLSFQSETKFSSKLGLIAMANVGIVNNLEGLKLSSDSVLPHVRTDIVEYLKNSQDYNLERLQLNFFHKLSTNIYTKISAGYLESMFAGIGGEVLYRPFNRNFGIGGELWTVQQRDYEMLLGLRDYKTITGHLNLIYKEPKTQIIFTLRGGKFLAKDSGINLDFSRRFPSGVRIGAFFTRTDISKREFGEGSFDKGFYFHIPVDIFFDKHSLGYTGFGLRPLTRDGGALLSHSHHLWGITESAQRTNIVRDWEDLYE
jgi:hypothetical protein